MEFSFNTKRLRVYQTSCIPVPSIHRGRRDIFIAFRTDIDCPYPVCILTIWDTKSDPKICASWREMMGEFAEMIETNDIHRRQGLARELWLGLEKHWSCELHGSPVSDGGEALWKSLGRDLEDGDEGETRASEDAASETEAAEV